MWETVGVAVFCLRRTPEHQTELLQLRRTSGDPPPAGTSVAGRIGPGEREADAAVRELREATGLAPQRLYVAAFSTANHEPARGPIGRIGLFVAFVDPEAPVSLRERAGDFGWQPLRSAAGRLARDQRAWLDRIYRDFVRRTPDEALRIH